MTQKISVLLVEDEIMIRMMIAAMIEELGHTVAAATGELAEAVSMGKSAQFDLAILDVNLNGQAAWPVIDMIKARGLPFILATGYGAAGLPGGYRDYPTLQKPFRIDALGQAIEACLAAAHRNI